MILVTHENGWFRYSLNGHGFYSKLDDEKVHGLANLLKQLNARDIEIVGQPCKKAFALDIAHR